MIFTMKFMKELKKTLHELHALHGDLFMFCCVQKDMPLI